MAEREDSPMPDVPSEATSLPHHISSLSVVSTSVDVDAMSTTTRIPAEQHISVSSGRSAHPAAITPDSFAPEPMANAFEEMLQTITANAAVDVVVESQSDVGTEPGQTPIPTRPQHEGTTGNPAVQDARGGTLPLPTQPAVTETTPDVRIWVEYEEDLSEPSEEELKELESTDDDVSALDVVHHEKRIYEDVEDPEQYPVKKIRLSWTMHGVRGTKEKPNYARVMYSPPAYIDGFYWHIKFFPRGNSSSSLAAYILCSRQPPSPEAPTSEGTFKVFVGDPDTNLGEVAPICEVLTPAPAPEVKDGKSTPEKQPQADAHPSKVNEVVQQENQPSTEAKGSKADDSGQDEEDWRVPAQLGILIYNPAEPRVGHFAASEHQFNKHNSDWGWTNLWGPWNQIHVRQPATRKPLLQHDSLTIDAYIRIFHDPTEALFWHSSPENELQWDSKSLAGYFPMGTPPLYHSPAVAGITAWLLLAPFRKALQSVDSGRWRKEARIKPQPVLSCLQHVLYMMRYMRKEEQYVNVNHVLEHMETNGKAHTGVVTFWDAFRRCVELELAQEYDAELVDSTAQQAIRAIADIFDTPATEGTSCVTLLDPLRISVEGISDVQAGLKKTLDEKGGKVSVPKFLPIRLNRERFDTEVREWKMLYDRVQLNDTVDLSPWTLEDTPATYTLYGFIVHVGERQSGKFYSVLRPHGPGSKWLAFEDGEGNKVFSYTKRRIADFEGLQGEELTSFRSTRQTAHLAMYIRADCFDEYLPPSLEPYQLPLWLRAQCPAACQDPHEYGVENDEDGFDRRVTVYQASDLRGQKGLLDMYNIRCFTPSSKVRHLDVYPTMTFAELRHRLCQGFCLDNVEKIRLWVMSYGPLGEYTIAAMERVDLHALVCNQVRGRPLCLWMDTLADDDQVPLYGLPDPLPVIVVDAAGESAVSVETSSAGNGPSPDGDVAMSDVAHDAVMDTFPIPWLTRATAAATDATTGSPAEAMEVDATDVTPLDVPVAADADDAERVPSNAVSDEPAVVPATEGDSATPVERASRSDSDQSSLDTRPPPRSHHIYGFIQLFDHEKQEFVIHDSFFALTTDNVHDAMRRALRYPPERQILAWKRIRAYSTTVISSHMTFDDVTFRDGVDVIVGDEISEATKTRLALEGKCDDPASVSEATWMKTQRHPIVSLNGHHTLDHFGRDYYSGPFLHGRYHGANGKYITSSGNVYEGPWIIGARWGEHGKMTYQNGDTYEGSWRDDEKHGQGTFIQKRTGNKYVGGFENGKRWGPGITYWQVADEEGEMCQICYGEGRDALFYDCGHVCACVECARQVDNCPICRRPVKGVVRIYKA